MDSWTLKEEDLINCPVCGSKIFPGSWVKCYNCNSEFVLCDEQLNGGRKKMNFWSWLLLQAENEKKIPSLKNWLERKQREWEMKNNLIYRKRKRKR